ncbi:LuxR C-terminal-related transcriptional regulator [Dactylosporangium sp. NPDC051484]|uniref:helix-turn-helix transcriptional regulator n=1 Tax=Dactylosporangium sp. NPDC051484 TaxID=3154942 RepID=UPI00344CC809
MRTTALDRTRRAVLRLSHLGLDLRAYRTQLDAVLRAEIGWDLAAWSTTDPATLLFTSCVLVGRDEDHALEQRLFDLEFGEPDVNTFAALFADGTVAASLHETTGGDLTRSPRWRQLLSGLGVTDELRAVFTDRNECWGTFVGYRLGGAPFTRADTQLLAALGPIAGDGLRRCLLQAAAGAAPGLPEPPGVLVVDTAGAVISTSAAAERWLAEMDSPGALPSAVRSVAAMARAAGSGDGGVTPAQGRLPRRGGSWLLLHASVLSGDAGHVAVVIEPARQTHLADVLVRAYALTGREREVTELVLHGRSNAQIARALGIGVHTVGDHLKSIMSKLAVSSRADLVAELFGRHYLPARLSGSLPSPYGWYLPAQA